MIQQEVLLALPSKGAIADPTLDFLKECGLRVEKPNPRQYVGSIPALPSVGVLFQRVKDVLYKVADGVAHLGITGLDVVHEHPNDELVVVHEDLGFGQCSLLVAVPEAWVDVETMFDLVDVALDFREFHHRNLRVATTYTHLTRQFLHAHGIHHFTLVKAEGAIEAAPTIGYADVIVDLMQTGTTLRENHLKPLSDGVIVESQACLIGNRTALQSNPLVLDAARFMLEFIDAAANGKRFYQVAVNMCGSSAEEVAHKVAANLNTSGLKGPTVSPIFGGASTPDELWYTVTVTIPSKNLLQSVEYLRSIGGTESIITPVRYIFYDQSPTFRKLIQQLQASPVS